LVQRRCSLRNGAARRIPGYATLRAILDNRGLAERSRGGNLASRCHSREHPHRTAARAHRNLPKGWNATPAHRYLAPEHLQFITTSTYRRLPVVLNPAYCQLFVDALRAVRSKIDFLLIGWVLMPDHFHVLVQPGLNQRVALLLRSAALRVGLIRFGFRNRRELSPGR
jgi:hypothetical protein